jgi:hypothetical protein
VLLVVAMGLGGVVLWGMGRDIPVPDWARTLIDTRLVEVVPNTHVRFGDMIFVVDEGWRPRVRVRNVRVHEPDGAEILAFSEVRASLSMRSLLEGRLDLKSLDVSGVFVTLHRDADRRIRLSNGGLVGNPSATRQAANLPQLITDLDEVLLLPGLSALTEASVRALTLRYEDAVAGRAWTADGGRLLLTRDGDTLRISADLSLLDGDAEAATLSANYAGQIGRSDVEVGVSISGVSSADVATQSPAFAWLSALEAPISGSVRGGLDASGALLPLSVALQIGAGVIQPTAEAQPIPIEGARSYFSYAPQSQHLRFDELSVRSKWVTGQLEGEAVLSGLGSGGLTDLVGQFKLSETAINPAALYVEPVVIGAAEMDFRLTLNPFQLQVGRLQIVDQDSTLTARGVLGADAGGWSSSIDADMDRISRDRLLALWPAALVTKTRDWIDRNLTGGSLHDIVFAFRRTGDAPARTFLGVDFEGAEARFLKTLPPIEDASGQFTLVEDRFVVAVDQGSVQAADGGRMDAAGTSFIIPDVRVKDGAPAIVRLNARGSVTAALWLLNQPPMAVMDKASLPVNIAEGRADVQGTLAFALKRRVPGEKVDVEYFVSGAVSDVTANRLIPDRTLAATRLSLRADNRQVSIGGKGTLDGVPFDAMWTQPIGPAQDGTSQVAGVIDISPEALETFRIKLPDGMVSGQGRAEIVVDLSRGEPPAFALTSDLRGVGLSIAPVSWRKPADVPGALSVSGNLGKTPRVDALALNGPGLSARGRVILTDAGALDRLEMDRFSVGDWLDVPVDLIGRGPGAQVGVNVRGGTLDLRNARFGSGGGGSSAPLTAAFDAVRITDAIELRDLRGQFTTAGGLDGTFTGKVNGGTEVSGRLIPQDGRTAVQLQSADAGGVLSSAGLARQVRGGEMQLSLRPVGTGDAFDGQLEVTDTSIQDAPVMAALINSVSIVGLVDELSGTGIFFSDVAASFRMSDAQITLTQASAEGPSLGLSMEGVFRTDTGKLNLQGVISPVYLLNGPASFLTRRGEGIIGFNYGVTGTAKAPSVSVNPFSVLAPGVFRELFRAAGPKVQRVEGEIVPDLPEEPPAEPSPFNVPLVRGDIGR